MSLAASHPRLIVLNPGVMWFLTSILGNHGYPWVLVSPAPAVFPGFCFDFFLKKIMH